MRTARSLVSSPLGLAAAEAWVTSLALRSCPKEEDRRLVRESLLRRDIAEAYSRMVEGIGWNPVDESTYNELRQLGQALRLEPRLWEDVSVLPRSKCIASCGIAGRSCSTAAS